jgi:cytosine/adenosine deaminase-related metal-dependent hydrolase
MQLCNLNIIGQGKERLQDIQVTKGKITAVTDSEKYPKKSFNEPIINFENVIAFPGLINSHDHLDFNLFPQTGNRIYNNYTEWGKDILDLNKETINAVLKIPQHIRTQWGLYKNLLNGITTVVNHGVKLRINNTFINVIQNNYCLHSIQFEENWKFKLNRILAKDQPFVIHIGEGTDDASHREIDTLIKWNLLKRKIIGVHGVAMDKEQATAFEALVWCPASNYFLLNNTAAIDKLKTKTSILFGTDSTLTAGWNLWEHIRLARNTQLVSDKELFDMITTKPAEVWGLRGSGKIAEGHTADIVIAKKNNVSNNFDSFFSLNPEDILLILHNGEVKLFDAILSNKINGADWKINNFSKIFMGESCKYVEGNLPGLTEHIPFYLLPWRLFKPIKPQP